MDLHQLSFGKIILLSDRLAEVIVDEDVELNSKHISEYHAFLLKHLQAPFCLLINKINHYSYDSVAQANIANLAEIDKMAVVSYNRIITTVTQYLQDVFHQDWNLKIFSDRDTALNWLKTNCGQ